MIEIIPETAEQRQSDISEPEMPKSTEKTIVAVSEEIKNSDDAYVAVKSLSGNTAEPKSNPITINVNKSKKSKRNKR